MLGELDTCEVIFSKYDTDKNKKFHNYSRQYEELLKPYREEKIKFLEIGVFYGESLKAFREVFKNAEYIIGLDTNQNCKTCENKDDDIYVEIGDATSNNLINSIIEKYGNFDIILDDGSHKNKDVIKSFELLFPLMNDGGLYIVEDTICYKDSDSIDTNYPNHLNYFFKFTEFLNQWRFDSISGLKDHCVDPFKIMKKTDNVFEYSIDKIEYGCSYIAINKKLRTHWMK